MPVTFNPETDFDYDLWCHARHMVESLPASKRYGKEYASMILSTNSIMGLALWALLQTNTAWLFSVHNHISAYMVKLATDETQPDWDLLQAYMKYPSADDKYDYARGCNVSPNAEAFRARREEAYIAYIRSLSQTVG